MLMVMEGKMATRKKTKPKNPVAYVCVFCYNEVPEGQGWCKRCKEYKGVCEADKCESCGELVARWDKKCRCGADNPHADEFAS